jgi:hypothetical protein
MIGRFHENEMVYRHMCWSYCLRTLILQIDFIMVPGLLYRVPKNTIDTEIVLEHARKRFFSTSYSLYAHRTIRCSHSNLKENSFHELMLNLCAKKIF